MNSYRVYLWHKAKASGRTVQIITDTFQNACNLARAHCVHGEEVHSVDFEDRDVVIDFAAAGIQDAHVPYPHPRAG